MKPIAKKPRLNPAFKRYQSLPVVKMSGADLRARAAKTAFGAPRLEDLPAPFPKRIAGLHGGQSVQSLQA